ncbi:right-handed parallel beta-helix repeat-containing protein [Planotetraspora sp. GP83]|uniref:right-handed parallel beta-helix repeat-containing protein n=1 Tax=Planotetraspora sp. GP83 TaxID=3156264 RepID=UPI003513C0C0
MRTFWPLVAITALTSALIATPAVAASNSVTVGETRYVATTGNNNNPGTLAQPWRTIQKAADAAPPGSTVYIRGGTYKEFVDMNVSGSATAGYTVFRNYDSTPVILDGNQRAGELIGIDGKSYIEIRGLNFRNVLGSPSAGVQVSTWSGPSHHIRIVRNSFKNLYASSSTTTYPPNVYAGAITVAGSDGTQAITNLEVDGNTIADCRTGWTEAIGITGNVDGFVVSNNTVTNTGNIGIDASGHWQISPNPANDFARNGRIVGNHVSYSKSLVEGGAGIYLDGSSNMIVERNIVHNNWVGIAVGVEVPNSTISDNIIRDNLSYSNDGYGIGVMAWSPENRVIRNTTVVNNTTFGNGQSSELIGGFGEMAIVSSNNTVVKNNVFYSSGGQSVLVYTDDNPVNPRFSDNSYYSSSSAFFDWNGTRYTSFSAYRTATGNDNRSAFRDPQFVNPGGFDFRLKAGSPSIDATTSTYNPAPGELDLDGNPRKLGTAVDRGAFEH